MYINYMSKEMTPKIFNFKTPRAGFLVLGRGHINHSENALFFIKIFLSTPRHKSDKLIM